jgi:hypothetical protein
VRQKLQFITESAVTVEVFVTLNDYIDRNEGSQSSEKYVEENGPAEYVVESVDGVFQNA